MMQREKRKIKASRKIRKGRQIFSGWTNKSLERGGKFKVRSGRQTPLLRNCIKQRTIYNILYNIRLTLYIIHYTLYIIH